MRERPYRATSCSNAAVLSEWRNHLWKGVLEIPVLQQALQRFRGLRLKPLFSIADQVSSATVGFLVAVYVGREMGADGLGVLAITGAIVLIVHAFQNSAVLEAMSVFGPRRPPAERRKYLGFLFALDVLWVGGITGLGALVAAIGNMVGALDQESLFVALSCLGYANLLALQQLFRRQFYVEHHPSAALTQSFSFLLLVSSGLWFLSEIGTPSVPQVYGVLAASSVIVCIVQSRRFRGRVALPDMTLLRQYCIEHFRYGRWVLLTVPFSIGMYQGYYFLVGYLLSVEQTGLLRAVDTLVIPFQQIGIGLSMMFIPIASRHVDDMPVAKQWAYARQLLIPLMALAAVYAGLLLLFGEELLDLVFGGNVAAAAEVLPAMAFMPVVQAAALPAAAALTAHKRPDLKFLSYAVATLGTMTVGIALILWQGLWGAALGLLFSQALFVAILWACLAWQWRRW